jgi:hypothetical protein
MRSFWEPGEPCEPEVQVQISVSYLIHKGSDMFLAPRRIRCPDFVTRCLSIYQKDPQFSANVVIEDFTWDFGVKLHLTFCYTLCLTDAI